MPERGAPVVTLRRFREAYCAFVVDLYGTVRAAQILGVSLVSLRRYLHRYRERRRLVLPRVMETR